jgi:LacI family transcriptional regulator
MPSKVITRRDVAKRAGVSTTVVSYVLNDGPRPVSASARARVEEAIRELGYYRNEVARSLRRQRSSVIGLMIPDVRNPVYAEIACALEGACVQEGYMLLLCNSRRDPVQEGRYVEILRAKRVDGVVVLPTSGPEQLIRPLLEARIPTVVLEHSLSGVNCLDVANREVGLIGTQHLLGLGHRRIGLIRRIPSSASSSLRFSGYRDALQLAGVALDSRLIVECSHGSPAGYAAMVELLALGDRPTAVLVHNDVLALGALAAVQAAGLRVPDDISIVGCDDIVSSAYYFPPLTTLHIPKEELGIEAGRLVLQLARDGEGPAPSVRILGVRLVERMTTGPPPKCIKSPPL